MNLKQIFTITLLLISSLQLYSQNSVMKTFNTLLSDDDLKNASISFRVIDVDTDLEIASHNATNSLVPASTMKIVSTASALVELGSYKRFSTNLEYDGIIDSNGILHGNIFVKGGGDPTLGSKYFLKKDEQQTAFLMTFAQEIKKLGIDSVTGKIIGDASYYSYNTIPTSWLWGDIGNYYGAGPNGLSAYDNTANLYFKSGANDGDTTTIEKVIPYSPNLKFDNLVRASNINSDKAYIYSAPYSNYRKIEGTIPKGKDEFIVKASLSDPAFQVAYDLKTYLKLLGVKVAEASTTLRLMAINGESNSNERTSFYDYKSPDIGQIAYQTNHRSINLFAEHLLNEMGKKEYNEGNNYSGSRAVKSFWSKHIDTDGMYVSDGSGMSRMNAISAYHLTSILDYMVTSKNYKSFYSSLPIAGKSGTMYRIGRNTYAEGRLRAKSGTMTRVKSYAGYVTSKSGKNLAFALIVNNYTCYNSVVTKKLEKLMVAIANH